ncbi:glycosyltransferase family 2 protein [soil metagenome]
MSFTLVSTVFNEIKRLNQTILDIESQTLKPSEIIITDAGSNDGTFERLLEWSHSSEIPVVILQKPKCNVAEGRNLAIQKAKYELIVSTDFGCRFDPNWLASIVEPFNDPCIKVVGGAYNVIEDEIISISSKAAYILSNGYQCSLDSNFIPSSRSIAYHRQIWEHVGGYPEWLTLAADDFVFGLMLKKKGINIYLVDKPYVYWGRHVSPEAYGKEALRYGQGDGEAQVNLRNFISTSVETLMRWSILFVLPAILLVYGFFTFYFYYILALMPFFFGTPLLQKCFN